MPLQDRLALAVETTDSMAQAGSRVKVATYFVYGEHHDKLYMNSLGARFQQAITYSFFDITAVAVDDTGRVSLQ